MDCVVRWKRPQGPNVTVDQVGVGVEFAQPGSAQHERLTALIDEIARPQKPRPKMKSNDTFRVLLVEDNVFVSELFRHAVLKFQHELENCNGHDLMVARTGHEALRMLEGSTPDVVILDHYLPGITGCSLVRKIRGMKEYENTPILMISVGGDEIRREALESGATLYMDKPILLTQLLDTLRVLMSRERACH
jgi:CheY-like chemotaxis protein